MVERLRVAAGIVFYFICSLSRFGFSLLASKKKDDGDGERKKRKAAAAKKESEKGKTSRSRRPFLEPSEPFLGAALEGDTPFEAQRGQQRAAEKREWSGKKAFSSFLLGSTQAKLNRERERESALFLAFLPFLFFREKWTRPGSAACASRRRCSQAGQVRGKGENGGYREMEIEREREREREA